MNHQRAAATDALPTRSIQRYEVSAHRVLALSVAVTVTLALLGALVAQEASPAERAEELFERAVEHFHAEEWIEAATLLREAYALDPNPRLAFNVARALERAERYPDALAYYRLALGDPDDADLVERATESITNLQRIIAGRTVVVAPDPVEPDPVEPEPVEPDPVVEEDGTLIITLAVSIGSPAFARIDGGPPERVPVQRELAPGDYSVSVEADGHIGQTRTVTVAPGGSHFVDVTLLALDEPSSPDTLRIAGIVTAGVGVALLGGGFGMYSRASTLHEEASSLGALGSDRTTFDDTVRRGKSSRTLSTVFYAVGISAVAGGTTMIVLSTTGARNDRAGADIALGLTGARVQVRF